MLLQPGLTLSPPTQDHEDRPGRKHLKTKAPPTATGSHTPAVEDVNNSPGQGKEPETDCVVAPGGDPAESPPPSLNPRPCRKNRFQCLLRYGANENKDEKEIGPPTSCARQPCRPHTHDVEGGLRVLDVAAVACDAGVAARVLGGHVVDHQGAVLEDVHPAGREAPALPTWPAPGSLSRRGGSGVGRRRQPTWVPAWWGPICDPCPSTE